MTCSVVSHVLLRPHVCGTCVRLLRMRAIRVHSLKTVGGLKERERQTLCPLHQHFGRTRLLVYHWANWASPAPATIRFFFYCFQWKGVFVGAKLR